MIIGPCHLEDLSFKCEVSGFKPSDHFALIASIDCKFRPKHVEKQRRFFTKKFNQEKTKEI